MRKLVFIVCLVLSLIQLNAKNDVISHTEFGCTLGHSINQRGYTASAYLFSRSKYSSKFSPFIKVLIDYKGEPKGVLIEDEPFSWWVDTGRELYEKHIISIGNVYTIDRKCRYKFVPYLGFGFKENFIQWDSSIGEVFYSSKSINTLGEAGVDFLFVYKQLLISLGISAQAGANLGVGFRYY